jgi:hypothetical protein
VTTALQEERRRLLRKMEDSRRLVRRFTSQLHDTQTFIKVFFKVFSATFKEDDRTIARVKSWLSGSA